MTYAPRPVREDADALVVDGRFQWGTWDRPFATVNPLDARIKRPVAWPRWLRNWRLKEWQAFQLSNSQLFMIVALFNAKTLALVQVKVFDRETGKKTMYERRVAPWSFRAPSSLYGGEMSYRGKGCEVAFKHDWAHGESTLALDIAASAEAPAIRGRVAIRTNAARPLVVALPFGDNHGMCSQKGLFPAEGTLALGDREFALTHDDGQALMDDHRGYYPYVMKWDWVTAAGRDASGRPMGFNLTRNQALDPDRYNENALFIGGEVHQLPAVAFTRHASDPERWTIRDAEGRVDLTFTVVVDGRVDIQAFIVESRYRGPFGRFEGTILDRDDNTVSVDGMFGMGERFYLRC